jgi:membrane protease subunit HflC
MSAKAIAAAILVIVVAIVVNASFFTLTEGEQAVITQFGDPVRTVTEAGLRFKIPFVQVVNILEKRSLPWDGAAELMQTGDKKRIYIDVWVRWRIIDPKTYFMKIRTEQRGYQILDGLVDSATRDVVSRNNLVEAVRTSKRKLQYDSEEFALDQAEREEPVVVGRPKIEAEIKAVAGCGAVGVGPSDFRARFHARRQRRPRGRSLRHRHHRNAHQARQLQ